MKTRPDLLQHCASETLQIAPISHPAYDHYHEIQSSLQSSVCVQKLDMLIIEQIMLDTNLMQKGYSQFDISFCFKKLRLLQWQNSLQHTIYVKILILKKQQYFYKFYYLQCIQNLYMFHYIQCIQHFQGFKVIKILYIARKQMQNIIIIQLYKVLSLLLRYLFDQNFLERNILNNKDIVHVELYFCQREILFLECFCEIEIYYRNNFV
eukprot:TRINITY_DN359_c0_g1_i1.p3 TRINITY_DN359_c0_g1~~TRINITY_DN359_c0_g1_i1.p3  ORF type:complete len:208 (+),score=-19.03 TRINITY_DN359_c0_g1_i1:78-701(+)